MNLSGFAGTMVDGKLDSIKGVTDINKPLFNEEFMKSVSQITDSAKTAANLSERPEFKAMQENMSAITSGLKPELGNLFHSPYYHTDYQSCGK